jgi:hypothetical protein
MTILAHGVDPRFRSMRVEELKQVFAVGYHTRWTAYLSLHPGYHAFCHYRSDLMQIRCEFPNYSEDSGEEWHRQTTTPAPCKV